ncbi:restriction endonuclease type II-like protein [Endogone sp. FLAS-F59071]|nr:restriction endonuclease type II-like protein [Endogone sp. FLAS-F59071]|eukprot:RUS13225.1 restriction endonuclease type II-like protein [Endogone sp. FLAS-F59071]
MATVVKPTKIKQKPHSKPNGDDEDRDEEEEPQFPLIAPIIFEPDTFDIVFILDNREIRSQQEHDDIVAQLADRGVHVEVRKLELGDALWIARRRDDSTELVLDYIIERKRMHDLVASIKDGRYVEQKTRMHHSGATHVVYVIEKYDSEALQAFSQARVTSRSRCRIWTMVARGRSWC